jgi:hydroxymethylbilane synthase
MEALKLGTRGSQLALYQANAVASLLQSRAGVHCEIVVIKTSGDRLADAPLAEIGGKRLFVKEIEDALLTGAIDLAVHSSKDMPVVLPDGLEIGAVLPREDARDAIVLPEPCPSWPKGRPSLEALVGHLGQSPRIGTSSVRRIAQLTRLFPDATFLPIRGNLDTRLRKLDSLQFDAIVLAAAGLKRLGFGARISTALPASGCIPAPGQGIIAVEMRSGDPRVKVPLSRIDDPLASAALAAERAVVRRLGGGCQMPIGAYAEAASGTIDIMAVVISLDGARAVRGDGHGTLSEADAVGTTVAERLLSEGAAEILEQVHRAPAAVEGLQP